MSGLPMLSVTVMMLRLIVESVILLKDEDCKGRKEDKVSKRASETIKVSSSRALSSASHFSRERRRVLKRRSPGLFWPLCASVGDACVGASAAKKNSVLWSY